jgi:hypothetical protein
VRANARVQEAYLGSAVADAQVNVRVSAQGRGA